MNNNNIEYNIKSSYGEKLIIFWIGNNINENKLWMEKMLDKNNCSVYMRTYIEIYKCNIGNDIFRFIFIIK